MRSSAVLLCIFCLVVHVAPSFAMPSVISKRTGSPFIGKPGGLNVDENTLNDPFGREAKPEKCTLPKALQAQALGIVDVAGAEDDIIDMHFRIRTITLTFTIRSDQPAMTERGVAGTRRLELLSERSPYTSRGLGLKCLERDCRPRARGLSSFQAPSRGPPSRSKEKGDAVSQLFAFGRGWTDVESEGGVPPLLTLHTEVRKAESGDATVAATVRPGDTLLSAMRQCTLLSVGSREVRSPTRQVLGTEEAGCVEWAEPEPSSRVVVFDCCDVEAFCARDDAWAERESKYGAVWMVVLASVAFLEVLASPLQQQWLQLLKTRQSPGR
ncbi:hypothetical protein F5148DRAFT_1146573 [Russula earlei]|uniref:Uncharacterized protein n=1 Tax=Russula earlei TaxID=71964 RepID=A0ACC0UJ99_9AGAM|nr:hypothetical protein F5148DRAFT_1146573 [Russula earlei]